MPPRTRAGFARPRGEREGTGAAGGESGERRHALREAEEAVGRAELEAASSAPANEARLEQKLQGRARRCASGPESAGAIRARNTRALRGSSKTLENNLETEASRSKPFPTTSTGRRRRLARWLTDRAQSADGPRGGQPRLGPALRQAAGADRLRLRPQGHAAHASRTARFAGRRVHGHGWSMKHLHRLIVTSNAYRLNSSTAGADARTRADSIRKIAGTGI